jgi:protocatechuate 3,4-dioxygenase beta subunit
MNETPRNEIPKRNSWVLLGALAIAIVTALVLLTLERSPDPPAAIPIAKTGSGARDVDSRDTSLSRASATGTRGSPDSSGASAEDHDPNRRAIRGEVHASSGAPIAGAEIELVLAAPDESHAAGNAKSDAAGKFEASAQLVDELAPARRALADLVATAHAFGFQTQTQVIHLRTLAFDAAAPLRFVFTLAPGNTVTGRVVDRDGAPVRGADVELLVGMSGASAKAPADKSGGAKRNACSRDTTRSDGRFALNFVSRGSYALAAREPHKGAAYREKIDLAADEDRALGDVVLRGDGVLAGTVRYPNGAPARAVELWAIPDWISKQPDALAATALQAREQEHDDGLFYGEATTDADGRFRFTGLRPSNYAMRTPREDVVLEPHHLQYVLGTENITLEVQTYRLVVHVKDSDGRPLSGANVACAEVSQAQDGHLDTAKVDHSQAAAPDASACFAIEPDRTYALTATSPGCLAADDLAILAPGEYQHELDLVLHPAGAKGRLHMTLDGAGNTPVSTLEVAFYSALTDQRRESIGVLSPDANGWLPPIPPGRYRIDAGFGAADGELPLFFPIRSRDEVEVRPGGTSEAVVHARAGARVRLTLEVSRDPNEAAAPRSAPSSSSEKQRDRELREHGAAVTVACGASSEKRSVQFARPATDQSPDQPKRLLLESLLAPGETALIVDLLEPGECTLHVEAPGFQSAEARVALRPGAIEDVRIPLIGK